MTNQDRIIALIRTLVPSLYGVALAWVIGRFEWVQDALTWLTEQLGQDVSTLIQGVLVAVVIGGYYWVARKLGARYPWLERWLLGRSLIPIYSDARTEQIREAVAEQARILEQRSHD